MTLDLLHDSLIQTDQGWYSLPGVMAALARGEVAGFPALRPHQRPAWHMFLVQLGVLALDGAGRADLPSAEDDWRAALRGLTADFPHDEPWHLIGTDRSRPAFLQPPDPGGLEWKPNDRLCTPDALDMLITSRNHDVKREIAHIAAPQDWVFALVSLQTMEGLGGRKNYGIARMNGGYSSRSMLALVPAASCSSEIDPSAWWRRDVLRLLGSSTGIHINALLWLEPWPEGRSISLQSLPPLFIEVCRRIRLTEASGGLFAERSTSIAPRIATEESKGNTGDPWAPIHRTAGHSFSLGEWGWTHETMVELLYGGSWKLPDLVTADSLEREEPVILLAEAISRGQGKTGGFHSRLVPVPKAMVADMFGERPVAVSDGILKDIKAVTDALSWGLRTVATNGDKEKLSSTMKSQAARKRLDRSVDPTRDALRRAADLMFFPELWARMAAREDADFDRFRLAFLERLAVVARAEFRAALPGIPCASLMRPRAEVRGRQALERGLHHAMRDVKQAEAANV